jgi:hypothetical protein
MTVLASGAILGKAPNSGGSPTSPGKAPAAEIRQPPENIQDETQPAPVKQGKAGSPPTVDPVPANAPKTVPPTGAAPVQAMTPEVVNWDLEGNRIKDADARNRVYVTPGKAGQAGQIHVVRNGVDKEFAETNRTLAEQQKRGFLQEKADGGRLSLEELKGKRVLDLAAGTQGTSVKELRERGIDAYGMDIALSEEAGKNQYLGRADLATKIPFKGQFDVVYELYGGLAYGLGKKETAAAFENAISRVEPGGTLYLAPLDGKAQSALQPFVESVEKNGGKLEKFPFHAGDEIWRLTMPSQQSASAGHANAKGAP